MRAILTVAAFLIWNGLSIWGAILMNFDAEEMRLIKGMLCITDSFFLIAVALAYLNCFFNED